MKNCNNEAPRPVGVTHSTNERHEGEDLRISNITETQLDEEDAELEEEEEEERQGLKTKLLTNMKK